MYIQGDQLGKELRNFFKKYNLKVKEPQFINSNFQGYVMFSEGIVYLFQDFRFAVDMFQTFFFNCPWCYFTLRQ